MKKAKQKAANEKAIERTYEMIADALAAKNYRAVAKLEEARLKLLGKLFDKKAAQPDLKTQIIRSAAFLVATLLDDKRGAPLPALSQDARDNLLALKDELEAGGYLEDYKTPNSLTGLGISG